MRTVLICISFAALVLLIAGPAAVYMGSMELATSKNCMFAATLVWFATAPFWMKSSGG